LDQLDRIDILINNAAYPARSLIDFTEKDWDDVMNINLRTLFFLSQAVVRVSSSRNAVARSSILLVAIVSRRHLIPHILASKCGVMD